MLLITHLVERGADMSIKGGGGGGGGGGRRRRRGKGSVGDWRRDGDGKEG